MIADIDVKRVLDVGCGEGVLLSKLQLAKIGKYREGIDSLSEAISLAKKLHPDLNIKRGSIYDLPYKNNSFDLLICTEVLEHLEDPETALGELWRVSSKYCLISVPNEPIFRTANFLRGRYITTFGNTPGHIQHWSKRRIMQFIEKNKFKILAVKTPFPWTVLLVERVS